MDTNIQALLKKSTTPLDFIKNPPTGERFISETRLNNYLNACRIFIQDKMKNGECSALTAEIVGDYISSTQEMLDSIPGIVYDDNAYVMQIRTCIRMMIDNGMAEKGLKLYLPSGYRLLITFDTPDSPETSVTTWNVIKPAVQNTVPEKLCSRIADQLTNPVITYFIRWAYDAAKKDAADTAKKQTNNR